MKLTAKQLNAKIAELEGKLKDTEAAIKVKDSKLFALSAERAKWEQRARNYESRLVRLSEGPKQLDMNILPKELVAKFVETMRPTASFTKHQVLAWAAANN